MCPASVRTDTPREAGTCANVRCHGEGASAFQVRVFVLNGRVLPLAACISTLLAVGGCGGHENVSEADRCREQIVLSFAPGLVRTDSLIGSLSQDTRVRLEYLRSISPGLHVFMLSASGKDPQCSHALARLRQDSRVRFAEPDARRKPHGLAR